jgi:hypothetical protein
MQQLSHQALARVLDVDAEQLWRAFWRYSTGEIRAFFLNIIGNRSRPSPG